MEQEIWKIIEGYPMYEVSNLGKVRKISSGQLLKQCLDSKGYPSVNVNDGKKAIRKVVHRFVAKAFILIPMNKPRSSYKLFCVIHIFYIFVYAKVQKTIETRKNFYKIYKFD